jgi:5-methylcytosine-specific restriction endonuclease McrA
MDHLRKETVLVLNRSWQAIHVKSPLEAMTMMYADTATALDIRGEDYMVPLKWQDWIKLPVEDESDDFIQTVRGNIKIPKVLVLCNYNKVPRKRPKFSPKAVWDRDEGTCQYTGRKLTPQEANIDHVIPRSRGGKTDWSNCVLTHKEVNSQKADRTPEEAGLKLIKKPQDPKELPSTFYIRNKHNVREWDLFLNMN